MAIPIRVEFTAETNRLYVRLPPLLGESAGSLKVATRDSVTAACSIWANAEVTARPESLSLEVVKSRARNKNNTACLIDDYWRQWRPNHCQRCPLLDGRKVPGSKLYMSAEKLIVVAKVDISILLIICSKLEPKPESRS